MTEDTQSTKEEILDATRVALGEYGYTDLSMGKIAEEFGRSQSLLHYHFDSKEKLLAAMVRRERAEYGDLAESLPTDPEQRLDALTDLFVREYSSWAEDEPMAVRYTELLASAHDSDPIRRELRAFFAQIRSLFVETVREGVETGVFTNVDPEQVGHLMYAASTSASEHWLTGEPDAEETIADALEVFVVSEVKQ